MKFIRLSTTNPYQNLAIEEYLFHHAKEDVFMLWQNEPTVVIGKNQNAFAEVNVELAKSMGVHIARRITGGGAVYHDAGNINYTYIHVGNGEHALDYAFFADPLIRALAALGIKCSLSGRNDIEVDGKKISGNAQYSSAGRVLHHGTLLFDVNLKKMSSLLRVDKEKLAYKAVKSVKGRVLNLRALLGDGMSAEALIEHIAHFVDAEPLPLPESEEILALRARNESDEWIYSEKRYLTEYSVKRKEKYPFGLVNVSLTLEGERIEDIVVSGDFFSLHPIEELEEKLRGKKASELSPFDVSPYIQGMSFHELLELLRL